MVVKMKIKRFIPKMLMVTELALTILVFGRGPVLAGTVESKVQQQTHTEAYTPELLVIECQSAKRGEALIRDRREEPC
jgi:hypothetical protein